MSELAIPTPSLVLLIGASGSGKSTFARRHFLPTEVISSDGCRGLVSDDETSQDATADAFDVLHYVAAKRLKRGRLTVIDATNVQREARASLVRLAREYHILPVAIVLNLPGRLCRERNLARPDRNFGPHVIHRQTEALRQSLRDLNREGFRYVYVLNSPEEIDAATIVRQRLWVDRRDDHGPFDMIGDVHGCYNELRELLDLLGYEVAGVTGEDGETRYDVRPPDGRTAIFLGDLTDRGPNSVGVLRLVMDMVAAGTALCLPGNHDDKLLRKLQGRNVRVAYGLEGTLDQLDRESSSFRARLASFLDGLVSHYVLDGGKLVVAHAGLKEEYQGRASKTVRDFALYGDVTGETDEEGFPIRGNWAADYRGAATVVYGHSVVTSPEWLNNTINIDTGCAFGGALTALRYPERQLVSVPARAVYYGDGAKTGRAASATPASLTAQQAHDDLLDLADVLGKRLIETRLMRTITIREDQSAAALEAMSRFAVDPRWLVYLPPTMSPTETSSLPDLLEHPAEAFAYFRHHGVVEVVAEEKHMGSRAVVIVCRDAGAARRRFGIADGALGIAYTRTGRRFFDDEHLESAFLERLRVALNRSERWQALSTDWVCLDAEVLPWSAKAQELLRGQSAAVGAAATASLDDAVSTLSRAANAGSDVDTLLERARGRSRSAEAFVAAYRRYVWPVERLTDLKLAPFHLLASEGAAHTDKNHAWHLATLSRLCDADPEVLTPTAHRFVDLTDPESEQAALTWWEALTAGGGEGMVVKPATFVARGARGLVQPAVKCRGREYLRIIYGPDYTLPEHLDRLRKRGLAAKRSLALREFALGIEALERFVRREPLRRVHECVFGVLALEGEPVDPRL
jgi:protein phosphatase